MGNERVSKPCMLGAAVPELYVVRSHPYVLFAKRKGEGDLLRSS